MKNDNQRTNSVRIRDRRQLTCEPLERRELLAGNVSAFMVAGSLTITGDFSANEISITRSGMSDVTITGTGTTVNFSSNPLKLTGLQRDLTVNLYGGNDVVRFSGAGGEPLRVPGNLTVNTHDGTDQITLAQVSVGGKLAVDAGLGNDVLTAAASGAASSLRVDRVTSIVMGDGLDQVLVDGAQFLDRVAVSLAGGGDLLRLQNSTFAKALTAGGGVGSDTEETRNSTFGETPVFNSFETQLTLPTEPPPPTDPPAGGESSGSSTTISENLTLVVATTGDNTTGDGTATKPFSSIQRALNALADKTIAASAIVTISVQNGTYNMPSEINIRHANAANIHIVGNTANESLVVLSYTDTDGLFVSGSRSLGLLDGVTLKGNWTGSGAAGLGKSGIRASENGSISLGDSVTVKNFYYGVQADRSGSVEADSIKISDVGDAGLFAYSGGVIDATGASITRAVDATRNLGGGVVAEIGGVIRCNLLVATDCLKAGIQVIGGNVRADGFNVNGNRRYGIFVERNGILDGEGNCAASNSGSDGIRVISGGVLHLYGTVAANNNGGSGLFVSQGNVNVETASLNGNAQRGVYATAGSSVILKAGSKINNNRQTGVEAFGSSYIDVSDCTIMSNLSKGLHAAFGSFIDARGATVLNTQNYGIAINKLSADGSLIKTI